MEYIVVCYLVRHGVKLCDMLSQHVLINRQFHFAVITLPDILIPKFDTLQLITINSALHGEAINTSDNKIVNYDSRFGQCILISNFIIKQREVKIIKTI